MSKSKSRKFTMGQNNSTELSGSAVNNIHHFAHPSAFFRECERVLKKDGLILIQEIHTSLFMRTLLWIMKHEGWSYNVDVFDDRAAVNSPEDPWSANCAIPELIFEQSRKFHAKFPTLKIEKNVKNVRAGKSRKS